MTDRPVHQAYAASLDTPCPTCGADAGQYCTRTDSNGARRVRRCPCVKRCPPSSLPMADERRWPARSFSEPVRGEQP